MISCGFFLFFSWFSGQDDFNNGKVSFLFDSEESFFYWLIDINNFLFVDGGDLVKIGDFSLEDFSDPESFFDQSFGCLDGDGVFVFTKEKG